MFLNMWDRVWSLHYDQVALIHSYSLSSDLPDAIYISYWYRSFAFNLFLGSYYAPDLLLSKGYDRVTFEDFIF